MHLPKDGSVPWAQLHPDVAPALARVGVRVTAHASAARYQTPARHNDRPLVLALALAAIALLTPVAAATVVRFSVAGDREVVIQTTDPEIQVIARGERIIRIIDPKTGNAYQLDREQLTLGLADEPNGLRVTLNGQQPIVLRRNGGVIATVRLARKGDGDNGEQSEPPATGRFFNGKDLSGWSGIPGYWKVRNGSIIGAPAQGVPAHTFLCSQQTYRDFELRFQVRRKNGVGNSGVQFRSRLTDSTRFTVSGPQIEIDSAQWRHSPGSIVTEPTGNPSVKSNAAAIARVWKEADFNDMTIRCVGEHVKVVINGVVAVDADFPSMPAEGIIAWQLHGGFGEIAAPEEVVFRNIHFTDLSQRRADGFLSLLNGVDLTGWKTHPGSPGDWRVEDGVLVGRGPRKNCLYSERGDYEDFRFRVEAMINQGGNSGQLFRKAFSAALSGDGYEAQIDNSFHAGKTGSLFVTGGSPTVRVAETLVPVDTWFTQEVIAQGNHIRILVNGKKVADHVDHNRTWRRGHFALQLYEPETVVRFRRIEVKELLPATAQIPAPSPPLPQEQPLREGGQVRARHILAKAERGSLEAAKNRLVAWKKQLLEAVDAELALLPASTDTATRERERRKILEQKFARLASEGSACPSRAGGGSLGWFQREGVVVEPFARAAFALRPFEISDPVATEFGYHLILVVEQRAGNLPPVSPLFPLPNPAPGFSPSSYRGGAMPVANPLANPLPNLFPPYQSPRTFC